MKFRGLLAAVVLLAALGGLAYWSEKRGKADEGKPAADAPPKILTIPEDQFKSIRLLKKGGEATVVTKSDTGKWDLTQPKPLAADQDAMTSLVTALASLNSERLIEDKATDLASYGLASPSQEVDITRKDGKVHKLFLGDDTPTGAGVYAKVEGDPRIFTVGSFVKSSLDKSSKDLRDKRLLTFNQDKITRVVLQAKGQALEFGKNTQTEWQILKPKPLRADGLQVDELVRKLKDARMDPTGTEDDAKKAVATFFTSERVAIAMVTDSSGTQQLEVRRDKDKNFFARSSVVEGVFKVNADLGSALDKGVDDFRNKKLFDFGFNEPSKIDVRNGATQVAYEKSGEKWMAGARVTSNQGKRNEKVIIAKQGSSYFARRENEIGFYELDGTAVEELQKAATEVKEFQPPAPKNDKKK
ncbi:MAG: DUF4340 domain-containing protein [Candidatus Solibacter usitatus]|nr:DUF4340 domain-containing protein [Candidatus Solibacter usitatus]